MQKSEEFFFLAGRAGRPFLTAAQQLTFQIAQKTVRNREIEFLAGKCSTFVSVLALISLNLFLTVLTCGGELAPQAPS